MRLSTGICTYPALLDRIQRRGWEKTNLLGHRFCFRVVLCARRNVRSSFFEKATSIQRVAGLIRFRWSSSRVPSVVRLPRQVPLWSVVRLQISGNQPSRCLLSTRRLVIDTQLDLIRRGPPMSFFTLVNMTCTGFGPMVSGWVEYDPHLQWRWIQWLHAMLVSSLPILI